MKKTLLFAAALFTVAGFNAQAEVVADGAALKAAIEAGSGDLVFELGEGSFEADSIATPLAVTSVTVKGAGADKTFIKASNNGFIRPAAETSGLNIHVEGITFQTDKGLNSEGYIFNFSAKASLGDIVIENCGASHTRGIVRTQGDGVITINSLTINNTVINHFGDYGMVNIAGDKGHSVVTLKITNSTIAHQYAESSGAPKYADVITTKSAGTYTNFYFNNNTVHDIINNTGKYLANFGKDAGGTAQPLTGVMEFCNNLFGTVKELKVFSKVPQNGTPAYETFKKENNYHSTEFGPNNTDVTGAKHGFVSTNLTTAEMFAGIENDDFTPKAGEAWSAFGDPRWTATTPDPGSVEGSVSDSKVVVATEYYDMKGVRQYAAEEGLFIVKQIMEDGSVRVSKISVRK